MSAGGENVVWVNSDLMPDGSYRAAISITADLTVALDRDTATSYVLAVLDAVQAAEYDAAVMRQLTRGMDIDWATAGAVVVADFRPNRRLLLATGQPLELVPGVSERTRKGFLTVRVRGVAVGQWDLADARRHAVAVLEALLAADYDTAYHAMLTGTIGLDDATARAAVGDIVNHRGK